MAPSDPPAPQTKTPTHCGWSRSRVVLLACLTLSALAGVWLATRPRGDGGAVFQFAVGQRLVYRIDFRSSAVSDVGAIFGEGPSSLTHAFDAAVAGELTLTVLEAGPERVSVVYELNPAEMLLHADGQEMNSEKIRGELSRPAVGNVDARGRILSVRFDPATGALAQHLTRTLLAATQFVRAPGANGSTDWQTEEDDPSGPFLAHYQTQADGAVLKAKVRYLQKTPNRKRKAVPLTTKIEPDGAFAAAFDPADGCLLTLSGMETQVLSLQGKTIGQSELELDMRLLRKQQVAAGELAALRSAEAKAGPAVTLSVTKSAEESRLAIERKALGGANLTSLLAELARIEKAAPEDHDLTGLFLKFRALVTVQPESSARLGEWLIAADARSLRMRLLTDALEAAGHAQAQAALVGAIRARRSDWPALALLIPALATAEVPTAETERLLLSLAFGGHDANVTAAARLGVGNLAGNLSEHAPARAAHLVERLLRELRAATSVESRWQLLLALGNAGTVEALPMLSRFLEDPAPELRAAAAWALRWIESPQADVLLTTKVLVTEKEAAVRLDAVRALGFRPRSGGNLDAQERALAAEPHAGVRLALLSNLWEARQSHPRALHLVQHAAAADPAPEVREAAAKILENQP